MKQFSAACFIGLAIISFSGCGTGNYSNLRPADNLKQGRLELNAGFGMGGADLLPVGQITYGLFDRVELNAFSDIKTHSAQLRHMLF